MGCYSIDPSLRNLQRKNRKQFTKGLLFITISLTIIYGIVQSVAPSNNSQRSCSRSKRQASDNCTIDLTASDRETRCEWQNNYEEDVKKKGISSDDSEACIQELQDLYGDDYQLNDIYYCDTKDFPTDAFNIQERQNGWVILHFIGMLYMFLALAIVCDEYFVEALDVITDKTGVDDNVAGATFMAAGGSAPELFTSLIGVFIAQSNVGIGTIVGSAVFNILFVLGMCAFVVGFKTDPKTGKGTILNLTWFPLARDCLFYIVTLVLLVVFFLDNEITWWESGILLSIYVAYVLFMTKNDQISTWAHRITNSDAGKKEAAEEGENTELTKKPNKNWGKLAKAISEGKVTSTTNGVRNYMNLEFAVRRMQRLAGQAREADGEDGEPKLNEGKWYAINFLESEGLVGKFMDLISLPLIIPMKYTIPDVRYKSVRNSCGDNLYIVSFFMSIIWISVFSWLMVWWATRIGETWNIDSALMGLTFLAAGTSVPDLLTSVIVAKAGKGDMAVSSSIGSNLFDVTVGLPLPWILWSFANSLQAMSVSSEGLICNIGMLLLMLVVLVGTIIACGWKMNRAMGFAMLMLYVVFVAVSLLLEYKILVCPSFGL